MNSKSPLGWAKEPASPWSVGSDDAYVTRAIRIDDSTAIGSARRTASKLADSCHFDETARGRVEIVVTELARNVLVHGKGGELLLRPWQVDDLRGIDVVALDKGPGIKNLAESLRDGYSTAGTPGTGLGAVARLGSAFDLFTKSGGGTAVFCEVSAVTGSPAARPGVTCVSKPGEDVPGDGWYFFRSPNSVTILVADGLGHGHGAQEAAKQAMRVVADHHGESLDRLLHRAHQSLAKTRGAAIAMLRADREKRIVHYMGVGNISGVICSNSGTQRMVSHNGTVGHVMSRAQEFQYPWPQGATIIMWSDGLTTNIDPAQYNGLLARHPSLVSAVLYRDHNRGRDDATALVFRDREAAGC
jgi:anti-sigma regulatory factor (Ser/Thr protein kinase)